MIFECIEKNKHGNKTWPGKITDFRDYGNHYEIQIESRSGIMVLFGKTTRGAFACIPDFGAGCYMVNPRDLFWNTEQLIRVLGKVDGITVAYALYTLADKIEY